MEQKLHVLEISIELALLKKSVVIATQKPLIQMDDIHMSVQWNFLRERLHALGTGNAFVNGSDFGLKFLIYIYI